MSRFIDLVLRHRVLVVLLWLVVATAGAVNAGRTVDALGYDFGLPGQPAYEANTAIHERFGGGGLDDPLVLVARAEDGTDLRSGRGLAEFDAMASRVAAAAPGARVVAASDDPDVLVALNGSLAVAVLYPRAVPGPDPYAVALPRLQRAAAKADLGGGPAR